ncbi:MAG: NAD(P)/FAD-dependent oxidoreductase [Cyclobacteriaceae bacterium]
MEKYDVCIIGGGPSGYAAAMRAVDFEKKVLLVEKDLLGGAGIHHGALTSKTWWEMSREALQFRQSSRSFNLDDPLYSFPKLKSVVRKAAHERMSMLEHHMNNLNLNREKGSFHFKKGTAKLLSQHNVEIASGDEKEEISAEYIILATGSRPRKLPHIPIDEEIILTSDGIDRLETFPKSMVILGAGVIGCEFATIFSNFGQTKVHLIDKGDRILPFEDQDIVEIIEKNLEDKGVLIHRNSRLIDMRTEGGIVVYTLEYTDGSKEEFRVEKALVSVGRVPNYENLFDDSLGIEIDQRGIKDDKTQTSISNIYAVGDITADIALVNVGELEGRFAIERIFGKPSRDLVYENISTIMFLAPEVAGVGLNETKCNELGMDYKMVSLDYGCISRAIAMRNTQGFIKIIVTNDDEMKILGMRVVGEHASSAIQAVALLISMNKGIEELAELIHPHPSIIEGIQECVRILLNKSMLKPSVMREAMTFICCKNKEIEVVKY